MALSARAVRERHLEAARGYLMLNMADHAIKELKCVADPELCAYAYHQLLGTAFQNKGEHAEALRAYERANAERPGETDILLGMAWCFKRLGQLPRAIAAMEEAQQAQPDQSIVMYNLSCYYALAGNKPQALSWLGRALRKEVDLRKLIADESDFDSLRDDPDFQMIVGAVNSVRETS